MVFGAAMFEFSSLVVVGEGIDFRGFGAESDSRRD
jgi:hypothetical protein